MPNLPMSVLTVPTEIEGEMVPTSYEIKDATARAGVLASVDLLKDTAGWIGGNKCKRFLMQIKNGGTFTVDDEGIVSLSGTTTAQTNILVEQTLKAGRYIVSGAPSGSTVGSYDMFIQNLDESGSPVIARDFSGATTDKRFTLASDANIRVACRVPQATLDTTKKFKPMILTEEQYNLNPAYRPYHSAVDNEIKANVTLLDNTVGWTGKNVSPNPFSIGQTIQGVAISLNADGSVRLNGTKTANGGMGSISHVERYLEVGERYKLVLGGDVRDNTSNGKVMLYVAKYLNGTNKGDIARSNKADDASDEFVYNPDSSFDELKFGTYGFENKIFNNIDVYPMLVKADVYEIAPSFEPYHDTVEAELEKKANTADVTAIAEVIPSSATPSNKVATAEDVTATVDLLKDTTGWIGGNLFDGKATSDSGQGLTWTVDANDNNIVTVSGTPTGFKAFVIKSYKVLPAGDYILSGISDMVNVAWNSVILYKNDSTVRDLIIQDVNTPKSFSILPADDYDEIRVTLKRSTNGVACSGTGKLMITTPKQYALNPAYRPPHGTVEEVKADKTGVISALNDTVGWISKNRIKSSLSTKNENGVTWTVNADKSVSTSGTTNVDSLTIYGTAYLKKGEYVISGNNAGVAYCRIRVGTNATPSEAIAWDDGEGGRFTINDAQTVLIAFRYGNNKNLSNFTFNPMICTAEQYALSPTYEPYHESVEEEIQATLSLVDDTVGWTGKNRFKNDANQVEVIGNVTITKMSDGSIDVDTGGEGANANIYWSRWKNTYNNPNTYDLPEGYYILSTGQPRTSDYDVYVQNRLPDNSGWDNAHSVYDETGEGSAPWYHDSDLTYNVSLHIKQGAILNHKVFKPMFTTPEMHKLSPAYEPYHESVEDWYWSENAKTGVHNFLNTEKFETGTRDGVTSTLRADKGISLTGAPTLQAGTIAFRNYGTVLKAGTYKYKLNKNPKGTCVIALNNSTTGLGNYKILAELRTNQTEIYFTVTNEDLASKPYLFCELGVYYNAGNIDEVYYPQILLEEDTFDGFMPFAMTNEKLTEKVTVKSDSITSSFTANGDVANGLKKIGEIVFIDAAYKEVTASQWDVIATIPAGFRPKTPCRILDGFGKKCLVINVNGDIQAAESISNTYVYIHGSWVVS